MALPITGPIASFPTESFADNFRGRYRQAPPYDRPLPYKYYRYYGTVDLADSDSLGNNSTSRLKDATFSPSIDSSLPDRKAHAYNQAYEKLKGSLGASAGWAENIAQAGQARSMFVGRALQLANFVRSLKRGRFKEAARVLKTVEPSKVSRSKALSMNFLEFEYGLKPLLNDLSESWSLLCSEPSERSLSGRSIESWSSTNTSAFSSGGTYDPYFYRTREQCNYSISVRCGATVRITNPNVFLANRLGLYDLALPWKLIPFSFIVDWFVNVEQAISASSDWFGVELRHPYHSFMIKGTRAANSYSVQQHQLLDPPYIGYSVQTISQESVEFERILGIPSPSLVAKPFKGFSLERGLQAISLVISVFGK
jgi:hypothetical protein